MTDLTTHLVARIRAGGPMRISEFMAEALLHPTYGYYTTRDPLGAAGDFTTAPEISQMFGEMIGLCLAQTWLDQGRPTRFALAELGPGRGTLMADILRATRAVPGFCEAAELHLVEVSPTLREAQRTRLGTAVTWYDNVADLPEDLPLYLVANEFFDALPIRQFLRSGPGWAERLVGLENEALAFGIGEILAQPALADRLADTKDGDMVEICPMAAPIAETIGARIETQGGVALMIDYGGWHSLGDTFQAMRAHETVFPLEVPGHADLTAHVDFEPLAKATPSAHSRLTPQGIFLERLGITARAQALAKTLSGASLESHIAAHRRLTHPDEMGNLFKTLAFYPTTATPPPGFEA
ncbi:MAG: class I SAM-dependent methyltransferase [Rhodobacteraceae bacterium]|nr:class I SAM-dependent methyltransferase [Paracoccaceae bacterium]